MNYLTALDLFHERLFPQSYVEIGCRKGVSLSRARCPAIAVDPDFEISQPLTAPTRIFRETSDVFFAARDLTALLEGRVDLAFVDGMHRAEFVLRDILNLERHATRNSVVLVDDILPEKIEWATRERETQAWTGDVYKIVPFLRKYRPDLSVSVFDVEMKGLAVITGFDPGHRKLQADLAAHEAALEGDAHACGSVEEIRAQLEPRPVDELAGFVDSLAAARGALVPAADPQGAGLYLDLLKRSLLNEIYLDDELRLSYLRACLEGEDAFDYAVLHDIREARRDGLEDLKATRRIGVFPERKIHKSGFSHTMMGRLRLDSLHACLDDIMTRRIPGDLMECGVWRGGGCIMMAGWMRAHGIRNRRLLVADSFDGLPPSTHEQDKRLDLTKEKFPQLAVAQRTVRENFEVYGLLDDTRQIFLQGWFSETLATAPTERIALLRLDGDLYESTMDALQALYDRVSPGGIVIVDDFALKMCRQAVADFFSDRGEPQPEMTRIDWTGAFFVKPN